MSTLLDSTFLVRVSDALHEHDVDHGDLIAGAPHLNLNASDGKHVFVKITRAGDPHLRLSTEVQAAKWAREHGISCPEALLEAPIEVCDDDGHVRAVTAWTWVTSLRRLKSAASLDVLMMSPRPEGLDQP